MKTICIKIYGNVVDFILVKNFNGNINTLKIMNFSLLQII